MLHVHDLGCEVLNELDQRTLFESLLDHLRQCLVVVVHLVFDDLQEPVRGALLLVGGARAQL